jgi:hypothetical protein
MGRKQEKSENFIGTGIATERRCGITSWKVPRALEWIKQIVLPALRKFLKE